MEKESAPAPVTGDTAPAADVKPGAEQVRFSKVTDYFSSVPFCMYEVDLYCSRVYFYFSKCSFFHIPILCVYLLQTKYFAP